MKKITNSDPQSQSLDLVADNISKLKELFPEILTEGKIDFDVLKGILGEEVEEGEEYYRFTWAGKAQARREAHKPSTGTLRPCPEESVDWDKTENLYIEGDNLEVLKLLQKSYTGKVKMIYIDPPYNTGKDFVYKDNYKDNLKNYQELTGQVDSEGNKLSTNSDSDGRYHSNWLNMMYPRLRLARNLLTDDGVIFMSIDDNEMENLRKISDEVFGSMNFIVSFSVQLNPRGRHLDGFVARTHEYVVCYAKNAQNQNCMFGLTKDERMIKEYDKKDEVDFYRELGLRNRNQSFNPETRPNLFFPIYINPTNGKVSLENDDVYTKTAFPETAEGVKTCWTWGRDKIKNESHLLVGKEVNGQWQVVRKDYLHDENGNIAKTLPKSLWLEKEIANDYGKKAIKKLFGKNVMDFPKSVNLLEKLLSIGASKSSLVVDFFSGSASFGEAVLSINSKEDLRLKHINVQLPQETDPKTTAFKNGYKTISDLGKERLRRVADKIKEENPDKAKDLDLGFKVFKLDSSNIQAWDGNPENLEENLFKAQDNIKNDRSEEDVLYEVLLKYGLDLTLPISDKEIDGKKVFNVGLGALFVCLGDGISKEVSEGIGVWKEELDPEICRVVFKDSGFKSDTDKTNAVQTLKRFGITEVKSI